MGQYSIQRLNNILRNEISSLIIRKEVKDPRVSEHLSINRVEVTKDLSYAKVYVSSFLTDSQVEKGVEGLNNARGFIQSTIAKKIRVRKFPHLTFIMDTAMKSAFHMVEKLNRLEKEENTSIKENEDKDAE